ncbi:hypothetical protein F0562_003996 [Nyssa sinensis]|uniref:DUF241 domain-containing protein n=1 Tax=Nyssa sinensis TaxID=561372 RepID=A0A5J5C0W1_9ASTE|nr:hypothetical protein F0562_003996 [Nyssa sinensis]
MTTSKSKSQYHIRSISLSCRSHPSTIAIEEKLNKFKTWEASSTTMAETICKGLSGLEELYKCVDDLYNFSLIQQAPSQHQHEKWVNELLDGSVKLLDICGITRDVVSQIKEHVRDLQSALRRRKGDLSIESSIAKYTCFRKKIKKDAKKLIAALKQMDNKIEALPLLNLDHHAFSVIKVLTEVSAMSISAFQSLLLFLSVPILRPRPTRWLLVSKLLHKGEVACEDHHANLNELESVDIVLHALCISGSSEGDKKQIAQNSLEALEASLEHQEGSFFSLLNKKSKYLALCIHPEEYGQAYHLPSCNNVMNAFRTRKGDLSIESSIARYTCFRKKMKKDAKKLIAALKQMDNKIEALLLLDLDHRVSSVIKVLIEVGAMSISTFETLLLFLSMPVSKPRPTRSHPSTIAIEEKLNKLKTWEASSTTMAETICKSLSGLEELYKCTDDLYNLPLTQQALSQHQHEKWVDVLLDGSMRLLDICGITRDVVSQIKEHVRDLQSALRRRKGDLSIESSIAKYTCFRKKMKKDAKQLIAALKQMDNKIEALPLLDLDHHVSSVIGVLMEVRAMSISTFQTLLLFLSVPVSKPRPTRWLLVSKLLHKGAVACEDQCANLNELESVDIVLQALCRCGSSEGDKMQIAQNSLEALEGSIEVIENSLECMFRHLIKARASLLNIVSH